MTMLENDSCLENEPRIQMAFATLMDQRPNAVRTLGDKEINFERII